MYAVFIEKEAQKFLESLVLKISKTVKNKCLVLQENPRPSGVKKIAGASDLYRIRSGNYRIIYFVDDRNKIIKITHIRLKGKRTYKGL